MSAGSWLWVELPHSKSLLSGMDWIYGFICTMEQHLTQFAQIHPCLSLTSPLNLLQPQGDGLLVQPLLWAERGFGVLVHTVHHLISLAAN